MDRSIVDRSLLFPTVFDSLSRVRSSFSSLFNFCVDTPNFGTFIVSYDRSKAERKIDEQRIYETFRSTISIESVCKNKKRKKQEGSIKVEEKEDRCDKRMSNELEN